MVTVATGRPTLIYFSSVRSGPSRRTEAFLDQVLQARRNHRTFVRRVVDVDRSPELARKFAVHELPTIVVVDGGRVATRLEGRKGVAELRSMLAFSATAPDPIPAPVPPADPPSI